MPKLGLIGYPLAHSFSKKYFTEKFELMGLSDWSYDLYPLEEIAELPALISQNIDLAGLNVTIPYKVAVMNFLDVLDKEAQQAGAVNTIAINRESGKPVLTGYNTDIYGFEESLKPVLSPSDRKALILGTGGASKAVRFVLEKLGILFRMVSRIKQKGMLTYADLEEKELIREHTIIVNTTPLGMSPDINSCPPLPYHLLGSNHLLYDLVYNPAETVFLQKGKAQGCRTKNGLEMLYLQAEKAWEIWSRG